MTFDKLSTKNQESSKQMRFRKLSDDSLTKQSPWEAKKHKTFIFKRQFESNVLGNQETIETSRNIYEYEL